MGVMNEKKHPEFGSAYTITPDAEYVKKCETMLSYTEQNKISQHFQETFVAFQASSIFARLFTSSPFRLYNASNNAD